MEVLLRRLLLAGFLMSMLVSAVHAQKKKAGPPTNVQHTAVTTSSVSLEWTPPNAKKVPPKFPISGYRVLYRVRGGSNSKGKSLDVPNVTSYTIPDLAAGTEYEFKMATITSNGKVGGFSGSLTVATEDDTRAPVAPNPPQNVRAGAQGTSIMMEWTPPQGSFDGYVVTYGEGSLDNNPQEVRVGQEELGVTIDGLEAGTGYEVSLQSEMGGVRSPPLALTLQTGVPVPSPPGNIRLEASPKSINVGWAHNRVAEEGVTGFELSVGPDTNPTEQTMALDSSETYTTVSGLQPGQVYVVSIKAQNQYGDSQPISDKITTQPARSRGPSPPTGMQMSADSNSVEVLWGEPRGDVDGYIVDVGPPDNPTMFSERIPRGTNSYRQRGLEPDTDYVVSVRSVSRDGESQPLQQSVRTGSARGPMPPAGARMLARSDSIEVMWGEAQGDISGYRVDAGPEANPQRYSQELPPGTTSYTVPNLEPNTDYQVSLVSTSPNGDSQPLRQAIRTTNISPPSTINMRASDTSLSLAWPERQETIDGYNVQVSRAGRRNQMVYEQSLGPDETSHTVTGLEGGTEYNVAMTSFRGGATSPPIQQTIRTVDGPTQPMDGRPHSPSGVSATAEGTNIRVRWRPVDGATSYMVRGGEASTGAPSQFERQLNPNKDEYVLKNLNPATDYLVSVSAVNEQGESRPTMVAARTEERLPGRPEGLAAETTPDTATLTWRSPGTPIDGYMLTLGTVTYPEQYSETLRARDTSFTFRDLEPDTIYNAELVSFNDAGNSMPITTKLRTEPAPAAQPPPRPGRMELTSTPTRINIRWQPVRSGVNGYRIRISDPSTGETNTVEVDRFQQSYAFIDLMPGKNYEVSIEAFNEDGYSNPVVQSVNTEALPSGSNQPQNTDVVATGTQIDAHWNSPILPRGQSPHSYLLVAEAIDQEGNPIGPRQSVTLHPTENEHTFANLLPATNYRVSVSAKINGTFTTPVVREVTTTIDGPMPPINVMADPISPNAVAVSWEFPVRTGPPAEVGGRRPDIYYTVRARNPEIGDVYSNSRAMTANVTGLQPDTLYEVSVAMIFNARTSDYTDPFAVRTFSNVDPRSPQFPTVTQVLLEPPENVHATFNWLPPREEADNIRSYNLEYTTAEDPALENTTWESVRGDVNSLGVVVTDLPTNGVVSYRVQPIYRGGEAGPFSARAAFSTPVAERPYPEDEPCQSHEDVTRQRINQITERVVPPLGMPLPFCDQFFSDFPCVWSPVCICIPRGTQSLTALPQSIRPASGSGCSGARRSGEPSRMYGDDPAAAEAHHTGPAPCQVIFDQTMEAIRESNKNMMPLMGSSLPSCRDDGYYNDIQCMGTMCLCVDEMGLPTGKMTEVWNVKTLNCGS